MSAVFAILVTVAVANLALAGLVLWCRPQAEVNRVFSLTAAAVAGWTLTNALFQATGSVAVATQAAAFSYLSAIALGASFLHFAWIFPLRSFALGDESALYKRALWSVTLVVGCLAFVPGLVIRSVEIAQGRSINTSVGVYAIAFFMVATSCWSFGRLLRQHARLHGTTRAQSLYVLTGSAVTAAVGLLCNLALPLLHNYALVWLGPSSALVFVGCSVYAIIAQHLFDIRIIIKRTLVYSILLAGIAGGYSATEFLLTQGLEHTSGGDQHPLLANIGGAVAVSFCVAPVRHFLEKRLNDLLFGRKHRTRHAEPGHHRPGP